jgi:hypothetical protein
MVKVTIRPWEEIVIHEVIKYDSVGKFIKQKTAGLPKGVSFEALLWSDGIVFRKVIMPSTADVIKEQLAGTIHYQSIEYAPMKKYKSNYTTKDGKLVTIIDVTRTEALRDVVAALKKYEENL